MQNLGSRRPRPRPRSVTPSNGPIRISPPTPRLHGTATSTYGWCQYFAARENAH
jgi:hypothetical protein